MKIRIIHPVWILLFAIAWYLNLEYGRSIETENGQSVFVSLDSNIKLLYPSDWRSRINSRVGLSTNGSQINRYTKRTFVSNDRHDPSTIWLFKFESSDIGIPMEIDSFSSWFLEAINGQHVPFSELSIGQDEVTAYRALTRMKKDNGTKAVDIIVLPFDVDTTYVLMLYENHHTVETTMVFNDLLDSLVLYPSVSTKSGQQEEGVLFSSADEE